MDSSPVNHDEFEGSGSPGDFSPDEEATSEEEAGYEFDAGPRPGDEVALASQNWDAMQWAVAQLLQDRDVLLTAAHFLSGMRRLAGPGPDRKGLEVVTEKAISELLGRQDVEKIPQRIPNRMVWKLGKTWRTDRGKWFSIDELGDDVDHRVLNVLRKTRADSARLLRTIFRIVLGKYRSLPEAFMTFDINGSRELSFKEFEDGMKGLMSDAQDVPSCLRQPDWVQKVYLILGGGGGCLTLHDFSIRLCGIGRGPIRKLRDRLLLKHHSITRAWEALATPEAGSKNSFVGEEDFVNEYLALLKGKPASLSSTSAALNLVDPEDEKQDAFLTWQARALFHMMDAGLGNANGQIDLDEFKLLMADVSPPCCLEEFRINLLLNHGSWTAAFQAVQKSGSSAKTLYGTLVRCAGTLDIRISDLQMIFERVCPSAMRGEVSVQDFMEQLQSQGKGFSLAEFSIRLWLGKPEGMSLDEVLARNPIDAARRLRLDEFSAELFGLGPGVSKLKSEQRKILPAFPRLKEAEVAQLYDALRLQHHGKVSLQSLRQSAVTSNVSDILATNKVSYSPGETAYIHYRVPRDRVGQLLEKPFIAMVSTEMKWVAGGGGGWMLRGKPITEVGSVMAVLPNKREGVVCVPLPLSEAFFERQEFRLFASPNGTRVGAQIGGGVSFEVAPPEAGQPVIDETTHNSMRLTWAPPELEVDKIKVSHYTLSVRPLEAAFEVSTKQSDKFSLLTKWDHDKQALRHVCSFRLDGLRPGLSYRTTVVPHFVRKDQGTTIEGPPSNPSEALELPKCIPPGPPSEPRIKSANRQEVELEIDIAEDGCGEILSGFQVYRMLARENMSGTTKRLRKQSTGATDFFLLPDYEKSQEKAGLVAVEIAYVKMAARGRSARILVRSLPTDGKVWRFLITAKNSAGEGALSAPSSPWQAPTPLAPPSAPGRPRILRVYPASVEISWTPPEDGCSRIAAYRVKARRLHDARSLTVDTIWLSQDAKEDPQQEVTCLFRWAQDLGGFGSFVFAVEAANEIGTGPLSPESDAAVLEEDAGLRLLSTLGMSGSHDNQKVAANRLSLGEAVEFRGGMEGFLQLLTDEGLGPPPPAEEEEEDEFEEAAGASPVEIDPEVEARKAAAQAAKEEHRKREARRAATEAVLKKLESMGGATAFLEASDGLDLSSLGAWLDVMRKAGAAGDADAWQELASQVVASGGEKDVAELLKRCSFNARGARTLVSTLAGRDPEEQVQENLKKLSEFVKQAGSLTSFLEQLKGINLQKIAAQVKLLQNLGIDGSDTSAQKIQDVLVKVKEAGGADEFLKAAEGIDLSALSEVKELALAAGIGVPAPSPLSPAVDPTADNKELDIQPGSQKLNATAAAQKAASSAKPWTKSTTDAVPELLRAAQAAGGIPDSLALLRQANRAGGAAKLLDALAVTAEAVPGAEHLFGSLRDEEPSSTSSASGRASGKNASKVHAGSPVDRAYCPLCGKLDVAVAREVLEKSTKRGSREEHLPLASDHVHPSLHGKPSPGATFRDSGTAEAHEKRIRAEAAAWFAIQQVTQAAVNALNEGGPEKAMEILEEKAVIKSAQTSIGNRHFVNGKARISGDTSESKGGVSKASATPSATSSSIEAGDKPKPPDEISTGQTADEASTSEVASPTTSPSGRAKRVRISLDSTSEDAGDTVEGGDGMASPGAELDSGGARGTAEAREMTDEERAARRALQAQLTSGMGTAMVMVGLTTAASAASQGQSEGGASTAKAVSHSGRRISARTGISREDVEFCGRFSTPEIRETLKRALEAAGSKEGLTDALLAIETSSRGFRGLELRLQLLDELLAAGAGQNPEIAEETGQEEHFKEDHQVSRSWRSLAEVARKLAGGAAELLQAAKAVDIPLMLYAQAGRSTSSPKDPDCLNDLLREAVSHAGATSLVRKLRKIGSLDAAVMLLNGMNLATPDPSTSSKKAKDAQEEAMAMSFSKERVNLWSAAIGRVEEEGGPANFLDCCGELGSLRNLRVLSSYLPRFQELLSGGSGEKEELNHLCDRIEECGNVSGFLWQLRGCRVDRLQQHAFAVELLKKSLDQKGEDLWAILEDRSLLERLFTKIAEAGGIETFLDTIGDMSMSDFAKNIATLKTFEFDQLGADGNDQVSASQQLLNRMRGAGGLGSFLKETEALDMSHLSDYVRLLNACGVIGKGKADNLHQWIIVAKRMRQEDRGCEIFLEVFGQTKADQEALSLRAVRRCITVLRQLGLLPAGGQTKKLEWVASSLKDVNLADLLELANSVGGFTCFRESVEILRAFNLGANGEQEALRLAKLWMELVEEVHADRGPEAFLAHLQALRKHTSLCRYCRNASSMPISPEHAGTGFSGAPLPIVLQSVDELSPTQSEMHLPSIADEEYARGRGRSLPPGYVDALEDLSPVRGAHRRQHSHGSNRLSPQKSFPELKSPTGAVTRTASMPMLRPEDRNSNSWR